VLGKIKSSSPIIQEYVPEAISTDFIPFNAKPKFLIFLLNLMLSLFLYFSIKLSILCWELLSEIHTSKLKFSTLFFDIKIEFKQLSN